MKFPSPLLYWTDTVSLIIKITPTLLPENNCGHSGLLAPRDFRTLFAFTYKLEQITVR